MNIHPARRIASIVRLSSALVIFAAAAAGGYATAQTLSASRGVTTVASPHLASTTAVSHPDLVVAPSGAPMNAAMFLRRY